MLSTFYIFMTASFPEDISLNLVRIRQCEQCNIKTIIIIIPDLHIYFQYNKSF